MCISVKFSGDAEAAVLRPLPYEKSRFHGKIRKWMLGGEVRNKN